MGRIIEGMAVVFCPLMFRNERWEKIGIPREFIHNNDFENVMQMIITRQTALMKEPRPFDTKINIILDYKKDNNSASRLDLEPEVFWDKKFGLMAEREQWEDLGVVFHLDYKNITKVLHPASFRNMQKEWRRTNPL